MPEITKHNVIVYTPQLLRGLKFNGVFVFDDMDGQIPLATCCHSLSLGASVCALIPLRFLSFGVCACIRWAHPDSPALWPCVPMCLTVCVLSSQGAGSILSLILDNGCIYILISDYLGDSEEGFLSAWCMQTLITMPWSCIRKSLLYAFSHFSANNLRKWQVKNLQERTETNLWNVRDLLYPSVQKGIQKLRILSKLKEAPLNMKDWLSFSQTPLKFVMNTQTDNDCIFIN